MEEIIKQLNQQFEQFKQEKNNYDKNKKIENFQDDETKLEDELITQAENMLDRRMQETERVIQMKEKFYEVEKIVKKLQRETENMKNWINNEEQRIEREKIHLKEETERLEIRKYEKTVRKLEEEKRKRFEEMNKTLETQRNENEMRNRTIEMKEKLSELVGMEVKDIIFNSDKHKWSGNDNEFGKLMKGHRHICIIVEDMNDNIFGGYCSKEIGIRKYNFDEKSFVFSLKRNEEYTMKKYPLKEGCYDLQIYSDSDNYLFTFGAEDKNNTCYYKDICIFKKDSTKKSYCQQYSYEYNGEENALRENSDRFDVKRIVVYQMEETNEMKEQREREEQEERENDKRRWREEKEEIERQINEMTDKQIDHILFDSEINKWSENDSEFGEIMKGKKDVIVLIEDERKNLFGGYIGNEIVVQQDSNDNSCYVFSLRKNGEFNPNKYQKNDVGYSYWIPSDSTSILISFGTTGLLCKDITLYKKDYSSGYCSQHCYNYNNEQFALTGKYWFNIKRIVVYQMKQMGATARLKLFKNFL